MPIALGGVFSDSLRKLEPAQGRKVWPTFGTPNQNYIYISLDFLPTKALEFKSFPILIIGQLDVEAAAKNI